MEKAYICSPLSGNTKQNIAKAIAYAKFVYERCGMIPVMSHFYALILDDNDSVQRQIGVSMGIDMLLSTTHVWVFGDNISKGMREEIKTAESLKRTIHYINDLQCKEIIKKYGGVQNEEPLNFEIAV